MARLPRTPQDAWQATSDLATEVERRQRATHLGHMTARGGAARWAGSDGTTHVTVGDLGDGTNGLSTDGRLAASGAVAAGGALSGASVASSGALSAADHQAGSNVPTLGGGNGAKLWVQSGDPGGAAANGDVWVAG